MFRVSQQVLIATTLILLTACSTLETPPGESNATDQNVTENNGSVPLDTTKPIITLTGASEIRIVVGETYVDAGAMARDDVDGDITDRIIVVNPVNSDTVGTYTITYNVKDAANNRADEVRRAVTVEVDRDQKIFLIGDSTMRFDLDGDRDVDGPLHRTGWGSKLSTWMVHPENVFNRARRAAIAGGVEDNIHSYRRDASINEWVRTHKGPYDWNTTRTLIGQTDTANGGFLLIQFGANDKYAHVNEADFKSHLKYYIDAARTMGVVPILVTPINPKSTLTDTRTPYTGYIKDVADAEEVPVIDLHSRSLEVYAHYTLAQRYGLFGAWKLDGMHDTTHLNTQGATIVAEWVKDLACTQGATQHLCDQLDQNKALLFAYAGEDRNVTPGAVVDLNGSGLDTDGTIERYRWVESGITLSTDRVLQYASHIEGTHLVTLHVTDNEGNEAFDTVAIGIHTAAVPEDRIMLEDAEDGEAGGWSQYGITENAGIRNITDDKRPGHVIELYGDDGLENGFKFTDHNISDHPIVSWAMRFNEDFKFFVKVRTSHPDHEELYITYRPDATPPTYEEIGDKKYIHYGLGSFARAGEWIDFERNVERDLQALFPDETLALIYGFYIRGNGRVDDISVSDMGGEYPAQSAFFFQATPPTPRVDLNASYVEAVLGTHVTRITDRANQTANIHPYPKQGSAWNSDGSILRMQYRLYDAQTFAELRVTAGLDRNQAYAKMGSPAHGAADIRWSKSDPNVMYVLDSSQRFKRVVINADRNDTVAEPPMIDLSGLGYNNITTGNNEGNLDRDDRYTLFAAQKENSESVYGLLYKLGDDHLVWQKEIPRGLWKDAWNDPDGFDWISVDPTAHYIMVNAERAIWLYDMNLGNEKKLDDHAEHGDMGIDVNGDPVYVQLISGGTAVRSYNLRTHEALDLLSSNHGGGHVSCRNYKRPGWCYVTTSEEGYKEVFALKLDDHVSGVVERFAQTHVTHDNRGLAQVNVSPDGTKVLFGSDWGDTDNALDTYQVDSQ